MIIKKTRYKIKNENQDKFERVITLSSCRYIQFRELKKKIKKHISTKVLVVGDIDKSDKIGWSMSYHIGFNDLIEKEYKIFLVEMENWRVNHNLGSKEIFIKEGIHENYQSYLWEHPFIAVVN